MRALSYLVRNNRTHSCVNVVMMRNGSAYRMATNAETCLLAESLVYLRHRMWMGEMRGSDVLSFMI